MGSRARLAGAVCQHRLALVSALLCGLAFGHGSAQAQGARKTTDQPGSEIEQRRRAGDTVRRSRQQELVRGERVTFEQVVRNPGDLNLAFRYAQQQIREGDLLGASGTLERILIANPRLVQVRAVYAIVLFRLKNFVEAERELKTVLRARIPDSLRRQLQPFIDAANRRQKDTRFTVLLSLGYVWDSNRNASASKEDLIRLFGATAAAPTGSGGAPDNAFQIVASLGVEHDISVQHRHRLVGSVAYYFQNQTNLHFFDTQSITVQGGYVHDGETWELQTLLYYRFQNLSQQPLVHVVGGRVDYRRPLTRKTRLIAFIQLESQNFRPLREVPVQRLRTGPEYRTGVELNHLLRSDLLLTGSGTAIRKDATGFFNDYYGVLLLGRATYLFGPGLFVLGQVSWEYDFYDDADPFVSRRRRRDHIVRLVGTIGVPVTALMPKSITLPKYLRATVFTVTGEMYRAMSNVPAFAYVNYKIGAALTFRFDF